MKNCLWLKLALVAVLCLTAGRIFARGGGHGGGHGGHHGGHHVGHSGHNAHHHGGQHSHSHHGNHHHSHYAHHGYHGWHNGWGGGWGGGWNGYGWPAAATYGAAAAWLGLGAADYVYGNPATTTVYTADGAGNTAGGTADAQVAAIPADFEPQAEAAAALAANGAAEPGSDSKFLPLGVYTLAPQGENESSATVHLAVDKDGVLRGTYHNALSDHEQTIYGSVDKKTQRVAWRIGPNGKTVFELPLKNLTAESSNVAVHLENGQTQRWSLARFDESGDQSDAEKPKNG